jgi:hypothetical protein
MNTISERSVAIRILVWLCCASLLCAQPLTPVELRQRAVTIPIGSVVEAKLTNKGGKVKGQLLSVSDSGVSIRTVEGAAIQERTVAFSDMKQLSHKKGPGTAIKILAGVGLGFFVLVIAAAVFGG